MLSKNLRKLREEKQFTRKQLSKKSGIHPNTIKEIEYGVTKSPKIYTLENLAKALGVSVNKLIE